MVGLFRAPLHRESVDYIADTTLRFLSSVSPYLLAVPAFQIRVVVISKSTRVMTVPVNLLCRTVIKLTSLMLSSTSTTCLSVQPLREIFAEYPLTYLLKYPCNCTSRETVILTVRIFEFVLTFVRVFLRDFNLVLLSQFMLNIAPISLSRTSSHDRGDNVRALP